MIRRVWRYQRGNENPYIEEQTTFIVLGHELKFIVLGHELKFIVLGHELKFILMGHEQN